MTTYKKPYTGPVHRHKSLAIEKPYTSPATNGALFVLPSATQRGRFALNSLGITESVTDHSYFDVDTGAVEHRAKLGRTFDLTGRITVTAKNSGPAWHELQQLDGGNQETRFMCHLNNKTLTPATDDPLLGGFLSLRPFNTTTNDAAGVWDTDFTHFINGELEALEAVLDFPGDLAQDALVVPTQTAISIEWTSSAATLETVEGALQIRGYRVFYRVAGTTVWTEDTTETSEVASAAGNLQTYLIDELTANTSYEIVVAPVWYFGRLFDEAAKANPSPLTISTAV